MSRHTVHYATLGGGEGRLDRALAYCERLATARESRTPSDTPHSPSPAADSQIATTKNRSR